VRSGVCRQEGDVFTTLASLNARNPVCELVVGLGVESHAFKVLSTLVADKALGMEAVAGCRDDAAGNRKGAVRAKSSGTDIDRRCPVSARVGVAATAKRLRAMVLWVRQWSC
jgi:hypothetical protein